MTMFGSHRCLYWYSCLRVLPYSIFKIMSLSSSAMSLILSVNWGFTKIAFFFVMGCTRTTGCVTGGYRSS